MATTQTPTDGRSLACTLHVFPDVKSAKGKGFSRTCLRRVCAFPGNMSIIKEVFSGIIHDAEKPSALNIK